MFRRRLAALLLMGAILSLAACDAGRDPMNPYVRPDPDIHGVVQGRPSPPAVAVVQDS